MRVGPGQWFIQEAVENLTDRNPIVSRQSDYLAARSVAIKLLLLACWIKADLTFEGLKQLLYEPEDRVHIGPTPPIFHDQARVIRTVRFSNSAGWFDDVAMPLNAGLVSIIGQKGSGKSALAELIAYAAGSWGTDEAESFLRRAGPHLQDITVELQWADDSVSQIRLGDNQSDGRKVRYLSQKFVERLCAEDHIGSELVHEIEAVIFS